MGTDFGENRGGWLCQKDKKMNYFLLFLIFNLIIYHSSYIIKYNKKIIIINFFVIEIIVAKSAGNPVDNGKGMERNENVHGREVSG